MNMKSLASAIAVSVALMSAATAHAATLLTWTTSNINVAKVANFNGMDDTGLIAGLTAKITYKLTSVSNSNKTWVFSYILDNTSSSPITASRVSGFGFDVAPNVTSDSVTGVFNHTASGNVPILGFREVCFSAVNCSGGGSAGVQKGGEGTGTFTLNFSSGQSSLTLDDLFVRYQSVTAPCLDGSSAVGVGTSGGVPEPATWAMMLVGFFGVGSAIRSSRRALATA